MVINFKVGNFAKLGTAVAAGGTPQNQTVTGVGFAPKALILFSNGPNTDLNNIMRPGFGMSSGATENRSISWGADDDLDMSLSAGTNSFRRCSEEYCFMLGSGGSTQYPKAKVSSFGSGSGGQFVLTYDMNDTSTYNIQYIAIGGADIAQAKVGSINLSVASGLQSFDIGMQPDIIFFFGANTIPQTGASTTGSDPGATWFLGAAQSSSAQHVMTNQSLDAIVNSSVPVTNNHAARYQRTNECIAMFADNSLGNFWAEASFDAFLPNGFRLNVVDPPVSTTEADERPIFYLAIKGGRWSVGAANAQGATGNQTITGSPAIASYTPKGLMLYGDQDIARTTIEGASHKFTIGATDGTNQFTCLGGDDNATDTTFTETVRGTLTTAVFRTNQINPSPSATTDITSSAAFSSFGSGQFVLNWTASDTSARQLLFVTAGDNPAGAALVKVVGPASPGPDMQITETVVKKRGLIRAIGPASPSPDMQISETVVKRRGIVRVIGGPPSGFAGGGFTHEGFTDQGFTTPLAPTGGPSADYTAEDFLSTDYITTAVGAGTVPTGAEFVGIYETVVKKLINAADEWVTPANLILVYSGGSSYDGSGTGAVLSLGGAISSVTVPSNTAGAAWDNVLGTEASAGRTEYRLFYLKNTHSTLTAYSVKIWISLNTTGPDRLEIGIAAAGVNSVETAVTSETGTSGNPPASVSFSTAPGENGALDAGDLPPGQFRGIWLRRIVDPSTNSFLDDRYDLSVSLVSSHA